MLNVDGEPAVFRLPAPFSSGTRAWLIEPDLVARTRGAWPEEAPLRAVVDALGPASRTAWIRAGGDQAVSIGDTFWLRIAGQPTARLDVRFVAPELAWCAVEPLARDPAVRVGSELSAWPSPGDARTARLVSAVSFVEERSGQVLAWIAAPPPSIPCPIEAHADFFHAGRCVGHGIVERRDERFWYVPFTPLAAGAEPATGTAPSTAPAGAPLRVGDDVRIRTTAEIEARRYTARIFDLGPAGVLVDAGETDGLDFGQHLTVYRAGGPLALLVVRRVQRSYCVCEPLESGSAPGATPPVPALVRVGDEVRLIPPRMPATPVGTVHAATSDGVFTATLGAEAVPLGAPLGVRAGSQIIAAAVLLWNQGREAGGIVLTPAAPALLAAGQELIYDPPPAEPLLPEPTDAGD